MVKTEGLKVGKRFFNVSSQSNYCLYFIRFSKNVADGRMGGGSALCRLHPISSKHLPSAAVTTPMNAITLYYIRR